MALGQYQPPLAKTSALPFALAVAHAALAEQTSSPGTTTRGTIIFGQHEPETVAIRALAGTRITPHHIRVTCPAAAPALIQHSRSSPGENNTERRCAGLQAWATKLQIRDLPHPVAGQSVNAIHAARSHRSTSGPTRSRTPGIRLSRMRSSSRGDQWESPQRSPSFRENPILARLSLVFATRGGY